MYESANIRDQQTWIIINMGHNQPWIHTWNHCDEAFLATIKHGSQSTIGAEAP